MLIEHVMVITQLNNYQTIKFSWRSLETPQNIVEQTIIFLYKQNFCSVSELCLLQKLLRLQTWIYSNKLQNSFMDDFTLAFMDVKRDNVGDASQI